jgi:hypothetical protein
VELSRGSSVSELIGSVVVDASGRSRGRVFELRGHWDHGGVVVIDELLVGRHGLVRRLRGPGEDDHGVSWEAVVRIENGRIEVAG